MILAEKLNKKIKEKNLSQLKLAKMIDYDDAGLNAMILGKRPISEYVFERIIPILEISADEINSWILADKYSKEVLKLALKTKRSSKMDCQPIKKILTMKLDEILQSKNLSRTALSKLTGNSQSGLNRAITGKETLSKKLMKKISTVLEIPENEIQSWVIADKYPLKVLELAVNIE